MYNPSIPPYGEQMGEHLRQVVFFDRRFDRRSLMGCCCSGVDGEILLSTGLS